MQHRVESPKQTTGPALRETVQRCSTFESNVVPWRRPEVAILRRAWIEVRLTMIFENLELVPFSF